MYGDIKDLNEMQLKSIELDYITELEKLIEEEGNYDVIAPETFISIDNNTVAKVLEHKTKYGKLQKTFNWNNREFYIYLSQK